MAKKNKAKGEKKESQSAEKSQDKSKKSQDPMARNIVVAALIIILLLAGIGFLIFGIVQSVTDGDDNSDTSVENVEDGDDNQEDDNSDSSDENEDQDEGDDQSEDNDDSADNSDSEGSVNGDAVSDDGKTDKYPSTSTSYSRGNDYSYGDITGSTHTVKKGDTLWQIAEARYGSGYAWTDINRANGGFRNLPNGTPVHLSVGQTIVLPNV